MFKYLIAVSMISFPCVAFADDMSSVGKWDGFYLGLKGGFGQLTGKDTLGSKGTLDSGVVGAFGGYNHSFDRIVVGVEADLNATNYTSVSDSGVSRSRSKWNTSATVRLGYDAGMFLPYLSAGVGLAEYEVKRFADGQKSENTHIGLVVGAGLEAMITENVSARLDYKHMEMSKEKYKFQGFNAFHIEGRQDLVTLGVAYNF
ncbi:outer membrane protein [Pseudovibrio sp. JE062]|uniref:outer membrane protein n=1 Tax=Pseudovibrio sp. JE062 TaxID=439495 RepID=UPI000186C646|nr:outer membrane beta-barrel protein [Pseudovibrio sp. JE062]EEA95336.1 outer membrane protein [Pseudovibrio sp. JE062]